MDWKAAKNVFSTSHLTISKKFTLELEIRAFGVVNWNASASFTTVTSYQIILSLSILERTKTKTSILCTQFIHWPSFASQQYLSYESILLSFSQGFSDSPCNLAIIKHSEM